MTTMPGSGGGSTGFPVRRMRRLRRTPALRRLVAETSLGVDDLVAPLFVPRASRSRWPIASLPGHCQHSMASLVVEAKRLRRSGIPRRRAVRHPRREGRRWARSRGTPTASCRWRCGAAGRHCGDALVLIADLCLDEYTDHGHCGVLAPDGTVDNDATLELYERVALAQAAAGADVVAPSGMMDGQVARHPRRARRRRPRRRGLLAYAAKFASALYGPFREAVDVTIAGAATGAATSRTRATGARPCAEVALDVAEGADIVMVKPALAYLDVIADVRGARRRPGRGIPRERGVRHGQGRRERGWIDGEPSALEHLTRIKRAGADLVLTYFAGEVAERC